MHIVWLLAVIEKSNVFKHRKSCSDWVLNTDIKWSQVQILAGATSCTLENFYYNLKLVKIKNIVEFDDSTNKCSVTVRIPT